MAGEIQVHIEDKVPVVVNMIEKDTIRVNLLSSITGVTSVPPDAHYKVTNLWVNKNTGKLHVEYESS